MEKSEQNIVLSRDECYYRQKKYEHSENCLEKVLSSKGFKSPFSFDLPLFIALNDIYSGNPLVPHPRDVSPSGLFAQADKRLDYLQKHFDLKGKRCLEVGCGRGETAVRLAQRFSSRVVGVDAHAYPEWAERRSTEVELEEVDLTERNPYKPESFDFIYSLAVLEHVQRPLEMLAAIHKLLKPGGMVYLTANLYRGPMASHRYREVYFPWPHLLFADEVFTKFYERLDGRVGVKPAWVNKLTYLHYLEEVRKLNFGIKRCTYSRRPFDDDFYNCFIEQLGRYPKDELGLDFINLSLYKPLR